VAGKGCGNAAQPGPLISDNGPTTRKTAERVARMYPTEVFKGRYHKQTQRLPVSAKCQKT